MPPTETIADRDDALDYDVTSAAVLAGLFGDGDAPRVGRYVLGGQIGQGAMGRIYRARDPELDRDVAIKMIHVEGRDDPKARARLVREAQALARVNHPNVVVVFEVGTHGRDVFVAMEWLRGRTLRRWVTEVEPSPEQCLHVLIGAGQGLAAAHQAGVVHRDFKPDNVLVTDDGRARVIDFGLAQTGMPIDVEQSVDSTTDPGPHSAMVSGELESELDLSGPGSITRTGTVLGSPAYMPPEQLLAAGVDVQSDQFAFCVTAFEMLHGQRPFVGRTPAQVLGNIVDGRLCVVSDEVPRAVDAVLRRGLACAPEDRWPTMEALLEQLVAGPTPRRRYGAMAAVAVVVIGVALAAIDGRAEPCRAEENALAGAWDEPRRATLRERLQAPADARVTEALDTYARAWRQARETACRDAASSSDVADAAAERDAVRVRRLHCLQRRKSELGASVDLLLAADARTREHAQELVAELPPPDRCLTDDARGPPAPPTDPAKARRVAVIEDALSRAAALEHAGHFDEAVAAIQPAMQPIPEQPWLEAEVRHRHASSLAKLGRTADAIEQADKAFFVAQQLGDDTRAIELATSLSCWHGWNLGDAAAAEEWFGHAEAILRRLGDPPRLSSELRWCRARVQVREGDAAAAVESFRRSIALAEQAGTVRPVRRAMLEHDLAGALLDVGQVSAAREALERSLSTFEDILGPEHPTAATAHNSLGNALAISGDLAGARPHFEAALRIRQRAAPGSVAVAMSLGSLGTLEQALGRFDEARELLERALTAFEDVAGPADPSVHVTLGNLAANATSRGDLDEARRLLRRRIELVTLHRGEDHPDLGGAHTLLGDAELEAGALTAAAEHYQVALGILERRRGAEHPALGYPLTGLGVVQRRSAALQQSEATLRRALALRSGPDIDPQSRADTEEELGLTLLAMSGREQEARAMLASARDRFEDADVPDAVARIEAVLSQTSG